MNILVTRAANRHIAAPLVGNYAVVHDAADDAHYAGVKEELRGVARRLERHREKMTAGTAVGLVTVGFEVR